MGEGDSRRRSRYPKCVGLGRPWLPIRIEIQIQKWIEKRVQRRMNSHITVRSRSRVGVGVGVGVRGAVDAMRRWYELSLKAIRQ